MAQKTIARRFAYASLLAAFGLVVVGCTASVEPVEPVDDAGPLGPINVATGDPLLFGVLNLEVGNTSFIESRQGIEAAVAYINEHLGGISGHPIELATCATDGQPATSARCANQILDQNPVAIIGAADTGSPGAIEVWARAGLAYIGGTPYTPVESNYENAVIFSNSAVGDPVAAAVYAGQELGAKTGAVIFAGDSQGTSVAETTIIPTLKAAGVEQIDEVLLPPGVADVSAAVATAITLAPDMIYIVSPPNCPNILASLYQLGNEAAVFGIAPCTSPQAIEAAAGGAEGLYFASPVDDIRADTEDAAIFRAAIEKYAPADIRLNSTSVTGFQGVMNLWAGLNGMSKDELTTEAILEVFRTGTDNDNFMGPPYTCDGSAIPGRSAICTNSARMNQIENGQPVALTDYFSGMSFYTPAPRP